MADMNTYNSGTVTAASGAATLHKHSGTVTSEALTTAAGADYTLTLTNNLVVGANSIVGAAVDIGAGSGGTPVVREVVPSAGQVVIKVRNMHASAAFNAAIKVRFWVVCP